MKNSVKKEEFIDIEEKLYQFNYSFFLKLAETDRYEIISPITETGKIVPKKQLSSLIENCNKLGVTIIYQNFISIDTVIYYNNKNKKIGYLTEGLIH